MTEEDRMDKPLQDELAQFHAGICQALADTTRIAILYELAEGRKNVSQLVEALGSPQATVSRHLKVLRERGMVNSERDGVNVYYSLGEQEDCLLCHDPAGQIKPAPANHILANPCHIPSSKGDPSGSPLFTEKDQLW